MPYPEGYPDRAVNRASDAEAHAGADAVQIILLHAENDEVVPLSHAHVLLRAAAEGGRGPTRAAMKVIPHAPHVGASRLLRSI